MDADNDTTTPGPPDWNRVRQEFPTTSRWVYMDIARKAILPKRIEVGARDWFQNIYESAGDEAFSMEAVEDTRRVVAEVFGAPSEQIALIKNTSEGVNVVARGFPWRPGDNVVISDTEHENNTFPWRRLEDRGVEVRCVGPDEQGRTTVDCYAPAVDARTRVISVAWVTYGNGYRADLSTLSDFCRDRGIRLVVDGIQAVGVIASPLEQLGVDVLVAGGHKAQFSLAGAGFMYATREMIELLEPPYAAKFSFASNDRRQPTLELAHDAHRFEYGNPNFLGCWVQKRSARFIGHIGLSNIEARVRALTTRLIEEAGRRQLRIRTPIRWEERAGIVSIDLDRHAGETVAKLKDQGVIVSEKDGHLRASVHIYNNEEDIEQLLASLQRC